jgi:hypothetical protein
MATATSTNPSDLFRQAIETFQSAIRTGVKIQEESARRFAEMMRDFGSPLEWQKNTQAMVDEAIKATQRSVDESMRLMNHNAQLAMSLWQKAFDSRPVPSAQEGQARSEELWQSALGALRTNTQVILQANARVLESWAQLAKEFTGPMNGQAEHAPEEMRQAAQH